MPNPRDVFENPKKFWGFLTTRSDNDFEGQYFDRKEGGRVEVNGYVSRSNIKNIQQHVKESISAFTNTEAGLLILGISKDGHVTGVKHLNEDQKNSITNVNQFLRNQTAKIRFHECENQDGDPDAIILFYCPANKNTICETLEDHPKAWIRNGAQNILINDQQREQLKRDKQIVNFEQTYCCEFSSEDIDQEILTEYKNSLDVQRDLNDKELLYEIGALVKIGDNYGWTNAGYLFFSKNPQRVMSWAYIRLLRFGVNRNNENRRGTSTLPERKFDGSIAYQIRKIRTFFRDSGFFKTFQMRDPNGGFIDEPEFPPIAVDETIVNAVAHRDYGIQLPIECSYYTDAVVIENPGRVLQRDGDVPVEFTLEDKVLNSMPRNSKLIEWMKTTNFVQALSEGTKRMRDEMDQANLPAPHYKTTSARTVVTLRNNISLREALIKSEIKSQPSTEYTNLFPLSLLDGDGNQLLSNVFDDQRKEFLLLLRDVVNAKGWFVDRFGFGRIIIHRQGNHINLPSITEKYFRFYPAYELIIRNYWNKFYLCIDYTLSVKNILSIMLLLKWVQPKKLVNMRSIVRIGQWQSAKILRCNQEQTLVLIYDSKQEHWVTNDTVIPDLPISVIKQILTKNQIPFDLSTEIKKHSLALHKNSSRRRSEQSIATAEILAQSVFPFSVGETNVVLHPTPETLKKHLQKRSLQVHCLPEPVVEFSHSKETADVRNGITTYGSYDDARKTIEIIPICTDGMRSKMGELIDRLKVGRYKYKGSERTFSTRFTYATIITTTSTDEIEKECRRLLDENPNWSGDSNLSRLFLVYTPEDEFAKDDENAPYYRVKRLLFENGIPCQMVDRPTLMNPDWKELNLTLNIVAKCGIAPWVLRESIPDADFFIGLSYTQTHKRGRRRLLGYSTVFNNFGRWRYFSGNTDAFSYEERTKYFGQLTTQTLNRLQSELRDQPSIYFHYSAKFSRDDRLAILEAARNIRPQGIFHFVSINSHHNLRLYDSRSETDGSLSRGSFVTTTPNQILLSTTGYNPYRKALGTPKPLEVTVRTEAPSRKTFPEPDLKALATQILSLTKLNWASTESICGVPITTKYAGNIAYLTDAFLRQTGSFKLHPVLENTPWFI